MKEEAKSRFADKDQKADLPIRMLVDASHDDINLSAYKTKLAPITPQSPHPHPYPRSYPFAAGLLRRPALLSNRALLFIALHMLPNVGGNLDVRLSPAMEGNPATMSRAGGNHPRASFPIPRV